MRSASPVIAKSANLSAASPFQDRARKLPTNSIVMRVARSLWPSKTDMALASKTGTSERMCRYWLSNKYNLSADDLAALLRSDEGFHVLEAIIGDARPVWWRAFKKSVRRSELRRQQVALAKAIEENEQSELDL